MKLKHGIDKYVGLTYNINRKSNLDTSIRIRVLKRVEKLRQGIYGDHHWLQKSELSELRMDFGKGYRIYYYDLDNTLILFVGGSEKKDQKKIIEQCNDYFKDFIERNLKDEPR